MELWVDHEMEQMEEVEEAIGQLKSMKLDLV